MENILRKFEEDAGGGMPKEDSTGHEVCSNLTFDLIGNCHWDCSSLSPLPGVVTILCAFA